MHTLARSTLLALAAISTFAWAGKTVEVTTSLNDSFRISETGQWNVKVERELTLRQADVRIDDKNGYPFGLMLYFKADTADLAQFDSPEKMKRAACSGCPRTPRWASAS